MFLFGGVKIGRIGGIPLFINPSWFLVFALVTFNLATSALPLLIEGEQAWAYWLLAVATAVLFFASLLAHEMGHSLVARAYGIPVRSITLHLLGGVAQLGREVARAREELWIALAGPAVSLVLAGVFWGGAYVLQDGLPQLATALQLLSISNLGIVLFNMVPGFPLDGGRVLRAIIWGVTGNYRRATKVAATGGRIVGMILIGAGVYLAVAQDDLGSLWLALIGWVLINMARQSYIQAVIQDTLQRTPVSEAMIKLISVPGTLTLDELYAGYISTTGKQFYLVEMYGSPAGVLLPHLMSEVPWPQWKDTPLFDVMKPLEDLPDINPADSAVSALYRIDELRADMLRAVENGVTIGLVTRERLLGLMRRPVARV